MWNIHQRTKENSGLLGSPIGILSCISWVRREDLLKNSQFIIWKKMKYFLILDVNSLFVKRPSFKQTGKGSIIYGYGKLGRGFPRILCFGLMINFLKIYVNMKIKMRINSIFKNYTKKDLKRIIQSCWNQIQIVQWHTLNPIYSNVLYKIMWISEFFQM